MTKSLSMMSCLLPLLFAVPANAHTADQGVTRSSISGQANGKVLLLARNGADDPAGDDRGGRKGGRGRGGHDDGAGHA